MELICNQSSIQVQRNNPDETPKGMLLEMFECMFFACLNETKTDALLL